MNDTILRSLNNQTAGDVRLDQLEKMFEDTLPMQCGSSCAPYCHGFYGCEELIT